MARINYQECQRKKALYDTLLAQYDALIKVGIPKREVNCFAPPSASSGYSMGEIVIVKCNGETIMTLDNTKEYPRGCKYKAKYGRIVFNFTKTDLKKYIKLLAERDKASMKFYKKGKTIDLNQLIGKAYQPKDSIVKKVAMYGATWC